MDRAYSRWGDRYPGGFYWGMKFRVFWNDVIYVPRRDVGFDLVHERA